MLASSHSGAYVCLRCQSSLARRRAIAAASFFHNARYNSQAASLPVQAHPARKRNSERKIYPHGKLRGKKGGEVRESSQTLPVNALGKPAEIILLKDADLRTAKDAEGVEDGDQAAPLRSPPAHPKKSSKKDVLESVKKGSVDVDAASTNKSIEELRDITLKRKPEKGDVISEEEREKLIKRLCEGFRTNQLKQYAMRKGRKLLVRPVKESEKLPHSDWRPGTSAPDERHLILSARVTKKSIPKEDLAKTIIERGWQLRTDNPMQIGEMDVYNAQSFLQARDEYGILIVDQIAAARHVKMQVLTEKVLRITGDREATTAALSDISQKCLTAIIERIPLISLMEVNPKPAVPAQIGAAKSSSPVTTGAYRLSLAARNTVSADDLPALSSATGVIAKIVLSHDKKPYLRLGAHSDGQMQDAKRALYSMSDLSDRSKYSFAVFADTDRHQSTAPGLQLPPSALPYHHRGKERHRMVDAISQTSAQETKSANTNGNLVDKALRGNLSLSNPDFTASEIWKAHGTSCTVRLGYVHGNLHKSPDEPSFGTRSDALFTPGLSHIAPVLSYLSKDAHPIATNNLVSFVFRHDPSHIEPTKELKKGFQAKTSLPKDQMPEIRFAFQIRANSETGETVEATVSSIDAIMSDVHHCVALPNRAIDLCVSETVAPMVNYQSHAGNGIVEATFKSLIEEMKASIHGQGRLRAPPTFQMPIPRTWIPARRSTNQLSTTQLGMPHVLASYRFVGVEHRQSISFMHEGQELVFATVDCGKLGPRYSELSQMSAANQQIGVAGDSVRLRTARLKAAFDLGFELVDLVDRAAKGILVHKTGTDKADVEVGEKDNLPEQMDVDEPMSVGEQAAAQPQQENEREHEEEHRAAASG